jgi:hypothetical protein
MSQETGETALAIMEDDKKRLEEIVNANKDRKDPYWIVIFAKPAHQMFQGKHALLKHFKPYTTKPRSQVGQIVGEVNNKTGKILWEVNMPQVPFDFDALKIYGAKPCDEIVTETTTIPWAYITQ